MELRVGDIVRIYKTKDQQFTALRDRELGEIIGIATDSYTTFYTIKVPGLIPFAATVASLEFVRERW